MEIDVFDADSRPRPPKSPQDRPNIAQDGSKTAPDRSTTTPRSSKTAPRPSQDCPKKPQDGSKTTRRTPQDCAKTAPRKEPKKQQKNGTEKAAPRRTRTCTRTGTRVEKATQLTRVRRQNWTPWRDFRELGYRSSSVFISGLRQVVSTRRSHPLRGGAAGLKTPAASHRPLP